MATVDEKLDRIILVVEHLADEMDEFRSEIRSELNDFRKEMKQETTMLRNQVASVAEALNTTIVANDIEHSELKSKDAALERMQNQHSLDIMDLRAAI